MSSGNVEDVYRPMLTGFILLFSLIAIFANVILILAFIIQWKLSYSSQHFTYFVLNMSMSGLLYAATNLWVSVPCTLDMCPFISTDHLMVALATPNSLAHWVYLLSAMSFTIYRFCLFMSKSFSDRTTCIKALVIAPWALTSLLIFGTTGLGCYKRYNRLSLSYTYNCSNCNIFRESESHSST